jgi:hypothetical protein
MPWRSTTRGHLLPAARCVTFPSYGDGCKLKDGRLYVQGVGLLKVKLHRPVGGTIKTVTVKRMGQSWYAVLVCEVPVGRWVLRCLPRTTGLDRAVRR